MAKLSELKTDEGIKTLIYGDSGAGKTVAATSFPGPIFVHDFDGKVVSAANFWRTHNPEKLNQIEFETYNAIVGKDKWETIQKQYATFNGWLVQMQALVREGKPFPFKTVVLDSITTWSDLLLKEIMRQTKDKIKGPIQGLDDIPGMQTYSVNTVHFKAQLNQLLSLPCNVVVTAHIEIDKDELTGRIERRPKATGKLATYLPIVFGEVYRQYVKIDGNNRRYLWQTQTDNEFNCRSQIPGLGVTVEATFKSLVKS